MTFDREQVVIEAVHAIINRPGQNPDDPVIAYARADVLAALPGIVAATLAPVWEWLGEWDAPRFQRESLRDLLASIEAAAGAER